VAYVMQNKRMLKPEREKYLKGMKEGAVAVEIAVY
jgi:hypothetical protein